MEGFVKNVAVEAPVAAKDEKNAFARRGGLTENGSDFLVGVDTGRVDDAILERLAKTGGVGMLRPHEAPLAVLAIPGLRHSDVLLVRLAALLGAQSKLHHDNVEVGALVGL